MDLARTLNLFFIDFRLSMCDQTDLTGFPYIENGKACYAPPKLFPLVGDALPINPETGKAYDGWLISMEEINSAPKSIQAIAYKLLHDRMVGDFHIHPAVRFVANGNLESDGAVVMPMSSALASRMVQFEAVIEPKAWMKWALSSGRFHPIVLGYLGYKPSNVHNFNPASADKAFPCPRTWEKVSKLLSIKPFNEVRIAIEGAIGEGTAQDLYAFTEFFKDVPKMVDVLKDPQGHPLDKHAKGINYATILTFEEHATAEQMMTLVPYVERMGIEYLMMFIRLRAQSKRNNGLEGMKQQPEYAAIAKKLIKLMF